MFANQKMFRAQHRPGNSSQGGMSRAEIQHDFRSWLTVEAPKAAARLGGRGFLEVHGPLGTGLRCELGPAGSVYEWTELDGRCNRLAFRRLPVRLTGLGWPRDAGLAAGASAPCPKRCVERSL